LILIQFFLHTLEHKHLAIIAST